MARITIAAVLGCALSTPAAAQPGRPEPPTRLLDAPVYTQRPQAALPAFAGEGVDVVVGWRAVAGAAKYRVTLTGAKGPTDIETKGLQVEQRALQPGRYQLTVTAIDASGMEGALSEPLPLTVIEVKAVPPGSDRPMQPLRGAYAAGTRFSVPGMHCETSNASVDDLLVLPENELRVTTPGRVTLRCAGIPGYLEKQVVIAPITLALDTTQVVRGDTTTLHVTLASVAYIGEHIGVEALGDVTLGEAERTDFGLDIPVAAPIAAKTAALSIEAGTFQLGRFDLALVDPAPAPPPPQTPQASSLALDVGGQVGAFFPPSTGGSATTIGHPTRMADAISSGPLIGVRLGYFPIPRVGLEGELSVAAGGYADEAGVAQLLATRLSLAVRVFDRGRFGFRLIGGAGTWSTLEQRGTSQRATEAEIHAGAAVTVETSPNLWLRFQLADAVTTARDSGYAHVFEAQLGILTRLGRHDSF